MESKRGLIPATSTKPIGKYLPGIALHAGTPGEIVYISGQVSSDSNGNVVAPGDPGRQAAYVFDKIAAILSEAGGDLSHLVSLTIYITDMANFGAVSGVRDRVLRDPSPSSTLVEVTALAIPEHLVEISGVAFVPAQEEIAHAWPSTV